MAASYEDFEVALLSRKREMLIWIIMHYVALRLAACLQYFQWVVCIKAIGCVVFIQLS